MADKKQMTESDIRRLYIDPALESKWDKFRIRTEVKITDGAVDLKGNLVYRQPPKKADYVLYKEDNYPIAVVEAKDNKHTVEAGLQQAMTYANMLDVPFAFSSNGDAFAEYDDITGHTTSQTEFIPMDSFPTEQELVDEAEDAAQLTDDVRKVEHQPYYSSQNTWPPRYYQQVAINRTLDAIARGKNRLLLVMATGTGKTYVAFQIVYRLLHSGLKKKILYLADRNVLIDQTTDQDFAPLKNVSHKIQSSKEDPVTLTSYQVYFALYQQLCGDNGEEEHFKRLFPNPDFFDLIIVDECHRGSAKDDSQWRKVLEYFSSATQIGMTATPKETKYQSNLTYFGEPVYMYSLKSGIEDGFLAPFKVVNITLNISDGWRPYKGQLDYFGNEIPDRVYTNSDFDYTNGVVLEDRINQIAAQITHFLKSTDRMAKTIVFCPTEEAAERMRIAIANLNEDMTRKAQKKSMPYVVRITGSDGYGRAYLDYFTSVASEYPVIATTSQLLSTGVDCKMVKLIVLDKMIGSMTEFKQIVGRGTRLRYDEGKTHFTIMDFRNVTRLFSDPDWDGPVEPDPVYDPDRPIIDGGDGEGGGEPGPIDSPQPPKPPTPCVDKDGCPVSVIMQTVSVYDTDGKLLKKENIIDYTKRNILGEYASLDAFIRKWSAADKKVEISQMFRERGIDLEAIKMEQGMSGVDDFDFICHVAYDQKPLTRKERADNVKKQDFFGKYSGPAKEVLEALLDRYMNDGIYEVENRDILKLDPFIKFGKPARIASYFGGADGYAEAVSDLESAIYTVG